MGKRAKSEEAGRGRGKRGKQWEGEMTARRRGREGKAGGGEEVYILGASWVHGQASTENVITLITMMIKS